MPVSGVFTGGNDLGSTANTGNTLTFQGTESATDVMFVIPEDATGSQTCSTTPTTTTESGPDYTAGNVCGAYLFAKTLSSGDISTGTCIQAWTGGSARNVAAGFATSGVDLTGIVLHPSGPIVQTTGNLTTRTITTTVALSEVYVAIVSRSASTTAPVVTAATGYTLVKAAKLTFGSSPNASVSIFRLTTPGAAGSYGGDTWSISSSPTHSIGYIWAVPPTASAVNVNVTAVPMAVTAAAPAGVVALAVSVAPTASPAAVTAAAPAGVVALARSITATATPAASTAAAPAGVVALARTVTVTTTPATLTAAAPAGSVVLAQVLTVTAAPMTVTLAAPAGVVALARSVVATTIPAAVTAAAPAGVVALARSITATATPAALTTAAPAGAVHLARSVTVTTTPMTVVFGAPAGTVATGGGTDVNATAVPAAITAAAPAGSVHLTRSVAVTGAAMVATLAMQAGQVALTQLVNALGTPFTVALSAPAGTVTLATGGSEPPPASRTTTATGTRVVSASANTRITVAPPNPRTVEAQ